MMKDIYNSGLSDSSSILLEKYMILEYESALKEMNIEKIKRLVTSSGYELIDVSEFGSEKCFLDDEDEPWHNIYRDGFIGLKDCGARKSLAAYGIDSGNHFFFYEPDIDENNIDNTLIKTSKEYPRSDTLDSINTGVKCLSTVFGSALGIFSYLFLGSHLEGKAKEDYSNPFIISSFFLGGLYLGNYVGNRIDNLIERVRSKHPKNEDKFGKYAVELIMIEKNLDK